MDMAGNGELVYLKFRLLSSTNYYLATVIKDCLIYVEHKRIHIMKNSVLLKYFIYPRPALTPPTHRIKPISELQVQYI